MDNNELTTVSASDLRKELSRDKLLRILARYEGEIQARDIVIAVLKSEKAKRLLHEAKYGQLAASDPIKALQRDSCYGDDADAVNEVAIGQMYETQLVQLERLIKVQRHCHSRSRQIISAVEKRHARVLRQLDEEKQRSVADAAQGDDVCALLENERTRLRQQLEHEQKEAEKKHKEIELLEKKLKDEQNRHKSMVLFLINERKQLLFEVHELKVQFEQNSSRAEDKTLLAKARKEAVTLREERDQLRAALDVARSEAEALRELARNQEEDLTLMRNSILTNAQMFNNNFRVTEDGSVVVINKGVSTIPLTPTKNPSSSSSSTPTSTMPTTGTDMRHPPIRPRLTNSSTFPATERNAHSRVPLRTPSSFADSTSALPASTKHAYHPPSTTIRQATPPVPSAHPTAPPRTTRSATPTTNTAVRSTQPSTASVLRSTASSTAAVQQLSTAARPGVLKMRGGKFVPQSQDRERMTSSSDMPNAATRMKNTFTAEPEIEQLGKVIESMNNANKRSASLPRNSKNGGITGLRNKVTGAKTVAVTAKRGSIFKAFGVSTKNGRNGS